MYASFFGLKHEPFSIAPDPRYLYMSERHREALAHLLYGLRGGGGFVLLSGEIGAGKTTVCRCFLEKIPKKCNVAYIFNPKLTVMELLKAACEEFGITLPVATRVTTVSDYVAPLTDFLLRTHAVGQNNVLIIDEAQNLSGRVLEQLRLLTNLETNERKLLQIILIGQPELRDILARPELEQLAQRVIARFHLEALSESETAHYIRHRMVVAGLKKAFPFDRRACRRIHQLCQGIPRRINLLCDRALLGAYARSLARVDTRMVDQAAKEVFYKPVRRGLPRLIRKLRTYWVAASMVLIGTLLLGLGLVVFFNKTLTASSAASLSARTKALSEGFVSGASPASSVATAPTPPPALPSPPPLPQTKEPSGQSTELVHVADIGALFNTVHRSQTPALRELATLWGLSPGEADPCRVGEKSRILCFSNNTTLAVVRALNRPVVLSLVDGKGQALYPLLVGLGPQAAKLRMAGQNEYVSLLSLAAAWRGDVATFWRAPAGFGAKIVDGQAHPLIDTIAAQLAAYQGEAAATGAPAVFDNALRAKLSTFQMASGLKPDGIPSPTSFMQLNRVSGVDEPSLQRLPDAVPSP